MRTTAAFVYFFISTLVGVGFGPPLMGLASDVFAWIALPVAQAGLCDAARPIGVCATASALGLRHALMASIGLYAWAAMHYWLAARALAAEKAA
jgi:hypothetical protein